MRVINVHLPSDVNYAERLDVPRRQLFVAMPRARDALWLGTSAQTLHAIMPETTR
jgi:hypothetical protein